MEEQLSAFPHGAKWRELVALTEAVAKVTTDGLRAPTVPENKVSAPKFNFGETFNRDPFSELCEVYKSVNGKSVKDRRGNQVKEKEIRNEGRANLEWLAKKNSPWNNPLKTGWKHCCKIRESQQTPDML